MNSSVFDTKKCYKTLTDKYLGHYTETRLCEVDTRSGHQHIFEKEVFPPCIPSGKHNNVNYLLKKVPNTIVQTDCEECKPGSCSVQGGRRRKTKLRRRTRKRHRRSR